MKAVVIPFVCALVSVSAAFSQYSPAGPVLDRQLGQGNSLRGSIVHRPGESVGNLIVELYSYSGRIGKAMVDSDGSFEFPSVPAGQFEVRVTDIHSNPIVEQTVWVQDGFARVQIQLPESRHERPASGTVSLAELMHKVPSKARKETELAQKAWKKHDLLACADHLQKALEIDPEYLAARNDLGLVYARMNQPRKVIEAFEEVLKIDSRSVFAYSLIAAAKASLGEFSEAEVAARRALQINSTDERTKYILGLSLAQQNKNDAEALRYLHDSAGSFPVARMLAARILARHGQIEQARSELEKYLPSASGHDRDVVSSWLSKLKE